MASLPNAMFRHASSPPWQPQLYIITVNIVIIVLGCLLLSRSPVSLSRRMAALVVISSPPASVDTQRFCGQSYMAFAEKHFLGARVVPGQAQLALLHGRDTNIDSFEDS